MPEYLSPGVYVEEVSFRAKSIEGVPTSTTGIAGLTRFGPVHHANGPSTTEPRLVTSFTEFERIYGGLEDLGTAGGRVNYTAHSARAFFLNGGKRLYVSRVFAPDDGTGVASLAVPLGGGRTATWRARWPGAYGNVWVGTRVRRSKNVAFVSPPPPAGLGKVQVNRAKQGAVVEIHAAADPVPKDTDPPVAGKLAGVNVLPSGEQQLLQAGGAPITPAATDVVYLLELEVTVLVDPERSDFYGGLGADEDQTRYVGRILQADNPADENAVVWLDHQPGAFPDSALELLTGLTGTPDHQLTGGTDGVLPVPGGTSASYEGKEADPDSVARKATGLSALDDVDDIAIVAIPDAGDMPDEDTSFTIHGLLVAHCELLKYRFAVVDGPKNATLNQIRRFRGRFDTKYAALYHPWIEILEPAAARGAGGAARAHGAAALGLRGRHLRPQRRRARRPQGAGQRGGARAHPVRGEHQPGPEGRAQPGGHQRAALLRGARQQGLGRAHHELGPRVEVRQRPAPVHLPRALDRQRHPVGRVRAEQRAALGERAAGGGGLPPRAVEGRRPPRRQAGEGVLRPLPTARP